MTNTNDYCGLQTIWNNDEFHEGNTITNVITNYINKDTELQKTEFEQKYERVKSIEGLPEQEKLRLCELDDSNLKLMICLVNSQIEHQNLKK